MNELRLIEERQEARMTMQCWHEKKKNEAEKRTHAFRVSDRKKRGKENEDGENNHISPTFIILF